MLREVRLPCCSSRKSPSSPPYLEMRPDTPFRTWDQRGFPWLNTRQCLKPLENLYKPQDPCCNRKRKLEFSPQLQMHPDSPATTREESRSVSANEKGSLTSLRDHQRFTAIPVVTPVEPRVSYCNLRKPRRFHLQGKMMPNSPALPPEQFRVPHQTWREASLPLWSPQEKQHKSRGTPKSLREHKRAPCTPNHLEMRADALASPREDCRLSTRTSRAGFYKL